MRNKSKSKRTEAALSLLVTSALVITLAIAVASAIKKGTNNDENNIINLNETESQNLTALNNSQQNTSDISNVQTPSTKKSADSKTSTPDTTTDNLTADSDDTFEDENEASDVTDSEENSDVSEVADSSVNTGYSFSEADTLQMPVNGEIVLEYNMDSTIWFPTLGVYKCNPGIYIAGNTGTDVIASASGTVESITQNEELGNIVTINMGNGYKASYGQLANINVAEGEVVLSGTVIGTVAEPTIYYTMEGSGVYFKLTRDEAPENPLDYME